MKIRYKLPKGSQYRYLMEVEKTSKLSKKELAALFGIVRRSYFDWKREKYAITQNAVETIEEMFGLKFPCSKIEAFDLWLKNKKRASQMGGIATYKKYGDIGTPEGRKKGGKHTLALLRARGVIPNIKPFYYPNKISIDLAEFIGILLGDGHIGAEQWSITVNSIADKEYALYVYKLTKKLFRFNPNYYKRRNMNAIVISGSGIKSIEYFRKMGLKVGNKVKLQVGVPFWIKSRKKYRVATLRGLMDTDGGVFLHKYKVNSKLYTYKKICFSNRSKPLLYFVADTLRDLGLTPKVIDNVENKKVWLYNKQEVERYLELVGTHNTRLLKYQR